jgi:hypothetical protein
MIKRPYNHPRIFIFQIPSYIPLLAGSDVQESLQEEEVDDAW